MAIAAPGSPQFDGRMTDLLFVLLVALCFGISLAAIVVCARVTEPGSLDVEAMNDLDANTTGDLLAS